MIVTLAWCDLLLLYLLFIMIYYDLFELVFLKCGMIIQPKTLMIFTNKNFEFEFIVCFF